MEDKRFEKIQAQRRARLKHLIEKLGGPTVVAKRLKLSSSSYVSQLAFGHRPITESTVAKIEDGLNLAPGWFDKETTETKR